MTAASLSALLEQLCTYLRGKLPALAILRGLPCAMQPLPIGKTTVAVDISALKTLELGLDRRMGATPASAAFAGGFGKPLELTLRLDLYHPDDLTLCCDAFSQLAGALLLDPDCPLDLLSLSGAPAQYSKADGAFHLPATAVLRAFLCRAEDSAAITDFNIRSDLV